MARFEVGKSYGAGMYDLPPITVVKRTSRFCYVKNEVGNVWRMLIREEDGNEYMIDSCVPYKWRIAFTYYSDREIEA